MSTNGIPGVEELGSGPENLRFIIGILVYAIALVGMIVYLVWKLPREETDDGEVPEESEGEEEFD